MLIELKKTFTLNDLVKIAKEQLLSSSGQSASFTSITTDSREVTAQTLFIACGKGVSFIPEAIQKGVAAILSDTAETSISVPHLQFKDLKTSLPLVLNYLLDSPDEQLRMIGVTGTNGKTSVNWMIYEACNLLNSKALRIGTLGIATPDRDWPADFTTPDLLSNYYYLMQAKSDNCFNAVMEVSSHALDQQRTLGINYDVAIYTNLTRDHFDYHQNFENYFAAKKKLFEALILSDKKNKLAIINQDCPYSQELLKLLKDTDVKVVSYGHSLTSDLQIMESHQTCRGAKYKFQYQNKKIEFDSSIIGRFNEDNFAVVIAFINEYFGFEKCLHILPKIRPVPGRLEPIINSKLSVFVDYAHTPDALENALKTLRLITPKDSHLWVIFGCGGDRDRGKRPLMGEIASKFADRVVVTSDNPRTESPSQIITDIMKSISADLVEPDRELAIRQTLAKAEVGDLVLIAGKGHEDYQEIQKVKYPFSDQLIVKQIFEIQI